MHIFHIPSWYPCRHGPYAGTSCENLIRSISVVYPDVQNTVSLYQETTYRWLFKPAFFREVVGFFKAKKGVKVVKQSENLELYFAPKSILYSARLGYKDRGAAWRLHRKNLIHYIENKGKPDLIHAQVTNTGGYAAWRLSKEFNIPYIITERFAPWPMPEYLDRGGKLIDEIYKPLHDAAQVISVSPAFAEIIKKYCDREVEAIPNFLDEDFFKPSQGSVTSQNEKFIFSTLALNYEPRKGVDVLIKAIKKIKDRGFTALFRIGGGREDEHFERMKAMAKELGVEDHIEWFGKKNRKEVVELMQGSHCFVLASTSESFGTVYIEAIACGKPVIATRCGGPESIVNETNGILISVGDADELSNALIHMITNYDKYDPAAIREDFMNRFSKKVVTSRYYSIYKEIIEKNKKSCAE